MTLEILTCDVPLVDMSSLCRFQPMVKWMLPKGVKTLGLSSEINKGPAMILFTHDTPLGPSNQLADMVTWCLFLTCLIL